MGITGAIIELHKINPKQIILILRTKYEIVYNNKCSAQVVWDKDNLRYLSKIRSSTISNKFR